MIYQPRKSLKDRPGSVMVSDTLCPAVHILEQGGWGLAKGSEDLGGLGEGGLAS